VFKQTDGLCFNCVVVAAYDNVVMSSPNRRNACGYELGALVQCTPPSGGQIWGCTENFRGYTPPYGGVNNSLVNTYQTKRM